MRAWLSGVLFVAVVGVTSGAVAGGPIVPSGPITPPKPGGILPPVTFKPPPSNSPAWMKGTFAIGGGTAPTSPRLIRPFGVCYGAPQIDCMIYGAHLGVHNAMGQAPAGYSLVVTDRAAAAVSITAPPKGTAPVVAATPKINITAWNGDLIAFNGLQHAGQYQVMLQTSAGKSIASLLVTVHAAPPAHGPLDEDHDGVDAAIVGGTDCDDSDDRAHPGNSEVKDNDDHDEDCNPQSFGVLDTDHDGFPDARACNVGLAGNGIDRYLAYFCGTDCDDNAMAVYPGQIECTPSGNDHTMANYCGAVGARSPGTDPRESIWTAIACTYDGDTRCASQPNRSGICIP